MTGKRPAGASLSDKTSIETSIEVTFSGVDDNVLQAKVSRAKPLTSTASLFAEVIAVYRHFISELQSLLLHWSQAEDQSKALAALQVALAGKASQ